MQGFSAGSGNIVLPIVGGFPDFLKSWGRRKQAFSRNLFRARQFFRLRGRECFFLFCGKRFFRHFRLGFDRFFRFGCLVFFRHHRGLFRGKWGFGIFLRQGLLIFCYCRTCESFNLRRIGNHIFFLRGRLGFHNLCRDFFHHCCRALPDSRFSACGLGDYSFIGLKFFTRSQFFSRRLCFQRGFFLFGQCFLSCLRNHSLLCSRGLIFRRGLPFLSRRAFSAFRFPGFRFRSHFFCRMFHWQGCNFGLRAFACFFSRRNFDRVFFGYRLDNFFQGMVIDMFNIRLSGCFPGNGFVVRFCRLFFRRGFRFNFWGSHARLGNIGCKAPVEDFMQ